MHKKKKTPEVNCSFIIPLAWKEIGGFAIANSFCVFVGVWGCVCMYVPVWLGFRYSALLWRIEVRLQPNFGQRCNGVPSYVYEIKGKVRDHLRSSYVEMLVFVIWVSFEKLKSDWNQPWVKDAIGVLLYVNEVRGHVPRSRVIWGQVK